MLFFLKISRIENSNIIANQIGLLCKESICNTQKQGESQSFFHILYYIVLYKIKVFQTETKHNERKKSKNNGNKNSHSQ